MSTTFSESDLEAVTTVLKALAHELRLRLMHALLEHGEKSVSELETLTGIGQPGLSQQLAILRKAELVQTRRRAKLIFYSLAPENLEKTASLIAALASQADSAPAAATIQRKTGSAATFARMI